MTDAVVEGAVLQAHIVYHMLSRADWEAVPVGGDYSAASLAREGFIHCTAEPWLLERVANSFYRHAAGEWLILHVDLRQVTAPVRWEEADGHLFPHIYGPIERAAVVQITPFPRQADGSYSLPEALQ